MLASLVLGLALNAPRVLDPATVYDPKTVSYTHLRAHETVLDLVCRLLLEKKQIITVRQLLVYVVL